MSTDRKISNISVIIPTLNEAVNISKLLPDLLGIPALEIIVADGGSTDETVHIAESLGARTIRVHPGKALQMNNGAKVAHGENLLFLHADTRLVPGFAEKITEALNLPGVAAGAFRLKIAGNGCGFRIIELLANMRSRLLQLPYGDQAIFVRTAVFSEVGGFPEIPVMEDFELIKRLKRKGRIRILPLPAATSPRRWKKLGLLRTTLINQVIIIGYLLGIRPQKLADWYRQEK